MYKPPRKRITEYCSQIPSAHPPKANVQQKKPDIQQDVELFVKRGRIAFENGLEGSLLAAAWEGNSMNVSKHLFRPDGTPIFDLQLDIWKRVINAYFAWFEIPRNMCTATWEEIIDGLLQMPPQYKMELDFQAWAFRCLCLFHLQDRKKKKPTVEEYDPENSKI